MLKPIYVKMPITIDEKHEYHRQGFRVVDERFKPVEEKKPRRRRNTVEDEE